MSGSSINNLNKPIVLLGMMGTGKTTFGKKLGKKLNLPFYDLDQEIEGEIGHSVSWIFENAGEEEFRKLETKKLKELLSGNGLMVLALGGGAFLNLENRKLITKKAHSVWLTASAETIHKRVSYRKDRPLLEGAEDKMQLIKNMMESRDKIYSNADHKIYTDKTSHKRIIEEMIEKISKDL